ncbi:MAG: hypothetical protein ACTIJJ_12330 [Galactobacter sp.]
MTAMTTTTPAAPARQGSRLLKVVKLQYVNRWTFVLTPLMVFAAAWVITLAIFAMVDKVADDGEASANIGGGTQAPLWYLLAVGIMSMTTTFPFSQALSITRKEFFTGTLLAAAFSVGGLAILFVLLGWVEQVTDGYGIQGYFGYLSWVWEAGPLAAWLTYFVMGMFFFVIGFWAGTVFKRYGSVAMTVTLIAIAVVLLGLVALITLTESWPDVVRVFQDLGSLGLTVAGLVLTALLAFGAYLTLRKMPA